MKYDFKKIEEKWQEFWSKNNTFAAEDNPKKKKFYALIEFPYPSGAGLHVGHLRAQIAMDIVCRKRRLQGYDVLFPIGWDAFGLPTENFAIKNNVHPKIVTEKNIANFKRQIKSIGISFDWTREIDTTDPNYFKWTQWIFLKLFENGLAYKAEVPINWCTSCNCVLANEESVGGICERCGAPVVQKNKSQWLLKITKFADELINDLKTVDFPEKVKTQQINWIGHSCGAEINFSTSNNNILKIFTTKPETIFGATYLVISPEHPILSSFSSGIKNFDEILKYENESQRKRIADKYSVSKEKTGVKIEGVTATNPFTMKEIPIFVSDYVLMNHGTGAIMAVPAHDERDLEFAKKFDLPIVEVVDKRGKIVNSDFLNGMDEASAKNRIIQEIENKKIGSKKVNYKLKDWVFSRQRYWGEPIPIIHCDSCGFVPLSEKDLPLELPNIESFKTSKYGESPLLNVADWVNTKCPKCGGPAKRETDTMPQWAGSSWYYLRYLDPKNQKCFAGRSKLDHWLPVDWYNGGMEHTTLHLLYSRFWHKFLYKLGLVPCSEPYKKRTCNGMILAENGEKMSKSRGNVVNPDEIVDKYGADTIRIYEMFIGDFEKYAFWNTKSIRGCKRFLERFWELQTILLNEKFGEIRQNLQFIFNKTVKKVTEDIENMKFNTAISVMMTLLNEIYDNGSITRCELSIFCTILNPFAPHITEEIWEINRLGKGTISSQNWPTFDKSKIVEDTFELVIQINGKIRDKIIANSSISQSEALNIASGTEKIRKILADKTLIKKIYVPKKLVNFVIK